MSLIDLSARLSARDITIAVLLDDHRVLTTEQITEMLFGSRQSCLKRLRALRRLGFVARFRPVTAGPRASWHWIPGALSARFVALAHEDLPPTPHHLALRQDAAMASRQLRHLVGANAFFTSLIAHSRTHPDTRLTRWWSAPETAVAFNRRIHPDGHGVWRGAGNEVGFYLEHDMGTEDHGRLVAKLDAYRRLHDDGGPDYPILYWLPGTQREQNLHERLATAHRGRLTVATATHSRAGGSGPARAVWWIAGGGPQRVALDELPSDHGEAGPYVPGPPTADQDPLHLLRPLSYLQLPE